MPGASSEDEGPPPVLEFCGVTKRFGGTLAVDDVSLDVQPGRILALLGANGAGKSTLIKLLAGIHPLDEGTILFKGRPYQHRPARAGERQEVAFIHQDLGLLDWMTVAENIAFSQGFPRRMGMIDWPEVRSIARRSLDLVAGGIDPDQRVQDLTRTEKSLVAIARALGRRADVLVLDEPTASLPQDEVDILFDVLRSLKARGVAMIYVSHRLDEVYAISDRLAVLRDGRLVAVRETAGTEPEELVRLIIGRPPEAVFVRPERGGGEAVVRLDAVRIGDVGPIDLDVRGGEILGLVGLRGAGHESVGRCLFGLLPVDDGTLVLRGEPVTLSAPPEAIAHGVCFVAGDRTSDSIAVGLSVRENMFLNPQASGRGLLTLRGGADEDAETRRLGQQVALQPNLPDAPIETLSGGNQQKVVMARWMRVGGSVLVLEDPTAGVDVAAKAEIYRLLADAVRQGLAVILVSTDFEEVAEICHRAIVFRDGLVVAELDQRSLSVERLVHAASLAEPAATADIVGA